MEENYEKVEGEVVGEESFFKKIWPKIKDFACNYGLPLVEIALLAVTASGMETIYMEDQKGNIYSTKAKKVRKSKAAVVSKTMINEKKEED